MVFAQTPTHYPTGSDPMEFTVVNILVYIVFPVLLFVFWFFVRRKQKGKIDGGKSI
jgi:RsiW-degrading membrane proteinase PrsW (M82 family)